MKLPRLPKLKPGALDARGLSHIIVPLLIVIVVAIAGTFALVASHADPVAKSSSSNLGAISVKAYVLFQPDGFNVCTYNDNTVGWMCTGSANRPRPDGTAHVFVQGASPGATCISINVHNKTDLGTNRRLNCTPGTYTVSLQYPTQIYYYASKHSTKAQVYSSSRVVNIIPHHTITVTLAQT